MTHIRGVSEGRLGRRNLLVGFSVGLALFVAIGAALAALAAPSPKPICPPYRPCGPPSLSPTYGNTPPRKEAPGHRTSTNSTSDTSPPAYTLH